MSPAHEAGCAGPVTGSEGICFAAEPIAGATSRAVRYVNVQERHRDAQAGPEREGPEQPEVDQRILAPGQVPQGETQHRHGRDERHPHPRPPVFGAADHQRHERQGHPDGQAPGADQVERRALGRRGAGQLRERPSFALIRLANLLRQECSDRLATIGLTMHQHAVLLVLEEFGPAVQKEVAARLSVDGGDLLGILDGQQQSGLLTRDRDPRDRRRQILTITDAGRRLIDRAEKTLNDPSGSILSDLEPARRAELGRLAAIVMAAHAPENWPGQGQVQGLTAQVATVPALLITSSIEPA